MNESSGDQPHIPSAQPVLAYASAHMPGREKLVTVGRYTNSIMAAMDQSRLADEGGIVCEILNSHVNALGAPYSGFTDVELQVRESEVERAREILASVLTELEPAEGSSAAVHVDDDGHEILLADATAFASVREMREAMSVLASAQVLSFAPELVRRGDKPAGTGKRFVLRVGEDDLPLARRLLEQADAESADDADPRCPVCRSYRIYPVPTFWKSFLAFWGLGKWPEKQSQCLACEHRASPADFLSAEASTGENGPF